MSTPKPLAIFLATTAAMIAFAANSILCRLALAPGTIDAAAFTAVRLVSGAAVLLIITSVTGRNRCRGSGSWFSGFMLFVYAVGFSFAYLELSTATGALVLFCSVQLTMIVCAIATGERPRPWQWIGLLGALGGFVYLVLPGLEAPSPLGSLLMTAAGVAWGVYTLRGRGNTDPVAATADNFLRAVPFILIVLAVQHGSWRTTTHGLILATVSGAVTSGIGYVIWYAALKGLTATKAAAVQLTVPVIAAVGGLLFMSEALSLRLVLASTAILGGIGLVLRGKDGNDPG
jgi:drug/metabolite transporter (DMT)-like permease